MIMFKMTHTGADRGFYKGGRPIYLKGWGLEKGHRRSGRGLCPLPRKCLYFLYQNGEFYAFPVTFIDNVLFKKRHPNQKGGCPDTQDTPGSAPDIIQKL